MKSDSFFLRPRALVARTTFYVAARALLFCFYFAGRWLRERPGLCAAGDLALEPVFDVTLLAGEWPAGWIDQGK